MAHFALGRFSAPGSLQALDPRILVSFVRPFSSYLRRRGYIVPDTQTDDIDYPCLYRVLQNPDETVPCEMVDALYYVHELSDEEAMDALLAFVEEHGIDIDLGPDPSPADVAMTVWLKNPEILKRQHARGYACRQVRFELFRCRQSGVVPSTQTALLVALQDHLDDWFEARKRGRGCQIYTFESERRHWIVVRHGEPYKREASIRQGTSACEYFRPETYDVLIYDADTGTIAVHAKGVGLIKQYLSAVGFFLFGESRFFANRQEITIVPLVKYGSDALRSEDLGAIDEVKLVEVISMRPGLIAERMVRKSSDVFAGLAATGEKFEAFGDVVSVSLAFTARQGSYCAKVTVRPPNIVSYRRQEDREIMEPFLRARGFMPANTRSVAHEPRPVLELA